MKAMILAAGKGTRLMHLTSNIPKALVNVNGIPLLEHVILKLKASGYHEIIINVHHFAEQIEVFLEQRQYFGIKILTSDERDVLLDSGGGLKKAAWFFDDEEPFLVHNVDIISDLNLKEFRDHHINHHALATVAVRNRKTSRYFLFNENMDLKGWHNSSTGEVRSFAEDQQPLQPLAFSGIHMMSAQIFELMQEEGAFSLVDLYLRLCSKHVIKGFLHDEGTWYDAGKPESISLIEDWMHSSKTQDL